MNGDVIHEAYAYGPQPAQDLTALAPLPTGSPSFKVNVRLPDSHIPIRLELASRILQTMLGRTTYNPNPSYAAKEALTYTDALLRQAAEEVI